MLHNHELDAEETCTIGIHVSDEDFLWTYDILIPRISTVAFSTEAVWSGGTPLVLYNKDFNVTDLFGLSGVLNPTVTDQGNIIDSTKYGAGVGINQVGAEFNSGWFRLMRNMTFLQTITSHANTNNIVTRFTFIQE
jgi:hypothetical protein